MASCARSLPPRRREKRKRMAGLALRASINPTVDVYSTLPNRPSWLLKGAHTQQRPQLLLLCAQTKTALGDPVDVSTIKDPWKTLRHPALIKDNCNYVTVKCATTVFRAASYWFPPTVAKKVQGDIVFNWQWFPLGARRKNFRDKDDWINRGLLSVAWDDLVGWNKLIWLQTTQRKSRLYPLFIFERFPCLSYSLIQSPRRLSLFFSLLAHLRSSLGAS